jgi:hypothetical protein
MTLFYRDRVRTTVNLMGDCYAVAVVDHLSRHELQDSVDDYVSIRIIL